MRTFGRIFAYNADGTQQEPQPAGYPYWVVVTTDPNGFNDDVYVTTLCQVLSLFLGESPFNANYGLPAKQDIVQQVQPDYYVSRTQQQFAPFFANLIIAKQSSNPPTFQVSITKHNGSKVNLSVSVPQ